MAGQWSISPDATRLEHGRPVAAPVAGNNLFDGQVRLGYNAPDRELGKVRGMSGAYFQYYFSYGMMGLRLRS